VQPRLVCRTMSPSYARRPPHIFTPRQERVRHGRSMSLFQNWTSPLHKESVREAEPQSMVLALCSTMQSDTVQYSTVQKGFCPLVTYQRTKCVTCSTEYYG